jgi:hypothetical protein
VKRKRIDAIDVDWHLRIDAFETAVNTIFRTRRNKALYYRRLIRKSKLLRSRLHVTWTRYFRVRAT